MGQTKSVPAVDRAEEVGVHKKNGMLYIYDFVPGSDVRGWLRLDSWSVGMWHQFPHRLA